MRDYNDIMLDLQYAHEDDIMLRKGAIQDELARRKQIAMQKITAYAGPFSTNNEVITRLIAIALKDDLTADIFQCACDLTQEDLLALQDNDFGITEYLYENMNERLKEHYEDYRYIG